MEVLTSGTLGDAFFILLKLYDTDVKTINHFTTHGDMYSKVKEIFSLLGDIEFNVLDSRPPKTLNGFIEDGETLTPFPKLDLPDISKYNLPEKYITLQLQAGVSLTKHPWRFLTDVELETIRKDIPIVIIGTDNRSIDNLSKYSIIDLRGKTTLFESFSIIRYSEEFYAPQGLLGFVALSQSVKTTLWLKHPIDIAGMKIRIDKIPEWKEYITFIKS